MVVTSFALSGGARSTKIWRAICKEVAAAARANPYAVLPFTSTFSSLVVTLDRKGAPSAPTLLDSGANIYVTAADASRPGDILLGGALAGQAAIFHLSEGGR